MPAVDAESKISSEAAFDIAWTKAPKVLEQIRDVSKNKAVKIVSFKLTHKQPEEEVSRKILNQLSGVSDFVVHNELGEITSDQHPYTIWSADGESICDLGKTKQDLTLAISKIGRT